MLDIGIITSTKYVDGGLQTQVLLQGSGSSCTPGLAYSPFGIKGRPRSPKNVSADGTVQDGPLALFWYEGNTLHAIPLDDGNRSCSPNFPALDEGGAVFYGDTDDAFTIYDGTGNLVAQVPASQKLTIQAKGGPAIVIDGSAGTVKVGGAAVPLALGSALKELITIMQAFVVGNVSAVGSPLSTSAAAQAALQALTTIQTTMLEGT